MSITYRVIVWTDVRVSRQLLYYNDTGGALSVKGIVFQVQIYNVPNETADSCLKIENINNKLRLLLKLFGCGCRS